MTPGEIFRQMAPLFFACLSILVIVIPASLVSGRFIPIAFAVVFFLLPIYNYFKVTRQFKKTSDCQSADAYLKLDSEPGRRICLILRPFGADYSIRVNSQSDYCTVEAIVAKIMRHRLDCETVALVDPHSRFSPKAPRYIVANEESWRETILNLLELASVVVLLLPAGQLASHNVRWELSTLLRKKISDRLIIVLPTPYYLGYRLALRSLHQYDDLLPQNSDLPDGVFMVVPDVDGLAMFSHLPMRGEKIMDYVVRAHENTYAAALSEALNQVSGAIERFHRLPRKRHAKQIDDGERDAVKREGAGKSAVSITQPPRSDRMKIRPNPSIMIAWLMTLPFFLLDSYFLSSYHAHQSLHDSAQVSITDAELMDTRIDDRHHYEVRYRFQVPGSNQWYSASDGWRRDLWMQVYASEWERIREKSESIKVKYVKANPWDNSPVSGPGSDLGDVLAFGAFVLVMNMCGLFGGFYAAADFVCLRRRGAAYAPRGPSFWYAVWDEPVGR